MFPTTTFTFVTSCEIEHKELKPHTRAFGVLQVRAKSRTCIPLALHAESCGYNGFKLWSRWLLLFMLQVPLMQLSAVYNHQCSVFFPLEFPLPVLTCSLFRIRSVVYFWILILTITVVRSQTTGQYLMMGRTRALLSNFLCAPGENFKSSTCPTISLLIHESWLSMQPPSLVSRVVSSRWFCTLFLLDRSIVKLFSSLDLPGGCIGTTYWSELVYHQHILKWSGWDKVIGCHLSVESSPVVNTIFKYCFSTMGLLKYHRHEVA